MKLWLDDVRKPPDETWTWCKSVEEALKIAGDCEEWALDHDLGGQAAHDGSGPYDFKAPTGYNFLVLAASQGYLAYRVAIHSTNHSGVIAMVDFLYAYASQTGRNIEIIVRPMLGRIMDRTPYYEPRETKG